MLKNKILVSDKALFLQISWTHLHTYSGLQKHCNVWQFWIACDVALYSIGITLSIAEMK